MKNGNPFKAKNTHKIFSFVEKTEEIMQQEAERLLSVLEDRIEAAVQSDEEMEAVDALGIIEEKKRNKKSVRVTTLQEKTEDGTSIDFLLKRMEYGNSEREPSKPIYYALQDFENGR